MRMKSLVIWMPALASVAGAQVQRSIPITGIQYQVTFDSATAQSRTIEVDMSFTASGAGSVLLSLPRWTPGAYEMGNDARFIGECSAASSGSSLDWDKVDPDTWRIRVPRGGKIEVGFEYKADSLDNAMSWSKSDFAFF